MSQLRFRVDLGEPVYVQKYSRRQNVPSVATCVSDRNALRNAVAVVVKRGILMEYLRPASE